VLNKVNPPHKPRFAAQLNYNDVYKDTPAEEVIKRYKTEINGIGTDQDTVSIGPTLVNIQVGTEHRSFAKEAAMEHTMEKILKILRRLMDGL
jgi:hypothetical protein